MSTRFTLTVTNLTVPYTRQPTVNYFESGMFNPIYSNPHVLTGTGAVTFSGAFKAGALALFYYSEVDGKLTRGKTSPTFEVKEGASYTWDYHANMLAESGGSLEKLPPGTDWIPPFDLGQLVPWAQSNPTAAAVWLGGIWFLFLRGRKRLL